MKFKKIGNDLVLMYQFQEGNIYVIQKKQENNKYTAKIGWDWDELKKDWYTQEDILYETGNLNEIARHEIKQIYQELKKIKKNSKKLNNLKIALMLVHQDLSVQKLF